MRANSITSNPRKWNNVRSSGWLLTLKGVIRVIVIAVYCFISEYSLLFVYKLISMNYLVFKAVAIQCQFDLCNKSICGNWERNLKRRVFQIIFGRNTGNLWSMITLHTA